MRIFLLVWQLKTPFAFDLPSSEIFYTSFAPE